MRPDKIRNSIPRSKKINQIFQMSKKVLLLNASEEVLRIVSWKRAMSLYVSGKATTPWNYDHFYDIKMINDKTFKLPSALVLKEYVHMPFRPAKTSRINVFLRDNWVCQYTGQKLQKKEATIDHIVPLSRGGKHEWSNIVTCSKSINHKKSDRTPEECGLRLIAQPKVPSFEQILINSGNDAVESAWSRWVSKN